MTMLDYLHEMKYAASAVVEVLWKESEERDELASQLATLTKISDTNYQRAEAIARDAEDADDVAMAAGVHWENYFGADKERYHKAEEHELLEQRLESHKFSTSALAANILQFAKQGISVVHSGLTGCPDGRLIGSQSLKSVIWNGRNQAAHWEEGSLRKPVVDCFQLLSTEADAKFADYAIRSMAFDIVGLLGWDSWSAFEKDMMSLS